MALWMSYTLTNDKTDLVVAVDWRLTQNGAIIHHDVWRYSLTDNAVIKTGAAALAARIIAIVKERARHIEAAVQVYTGVQAELGVPQNTVVQIL